jgi:hypothetical protein
MNASPQPPLTPLAAPISLPQDWTLNASIDWTLTSLQKGWLEGGGVRYEETKQNKTINKHLYIYLFLLITPLLEM